MYTMSQGSHKAISRQLLSHPLSHLLFQTPLYKQCCLQCKQCFTRLYTRSVVHNFIEGDTLGIGMAVYRVMFRYSNTQPDMTIYLNILQISIPTKLIERDSIPVLVFTEFLTHMPLQTKVLFDLTTKEATLMSRSNDQCFLFG